MKAQMLTATAGFAPRSTTSPARFPNWLGAWSARMLKALSASSEKQAARIARQYLVRLSDGELNCLGHGASEIRDIRCAAARDLES